jgi:hypothetical protein
MAEQGRLLGVSCVDMNVVVPVATIKGDPQYSLFECMIQAVSQQCEALYLRDCDLAELREAVGSTCSGDRVCSPSSDGYCVDTTCRDDITYKDSQGYYCDQWVGDDCTKAFPEWKDWGYTQADEDEILAKCPYSCKLCQRMSSADECDGATCDGVTANVGCRDRISASAWSPDKAAETSGTAAATAVTALLAMRLA